MMRSFYIKKQNTGFSLVEVMIYLAIFVVIVTVSIGFLFSLDRLLNQYRSEALLYRSGTQVLEHVLIALRQGDQVDLFATIQDSPMTGRLVVANSATNTSIARVGDELQLNLNGENYGNLLLDGVVVDGFTVSHYNQVEKEFVSIQLDISATVDSVVRSQTFYTGANVRGAN